MSEGQRVYVVQNTDYDDQEVLGVFSDREQAFRFMAERPTTNPPPIVFSWELDNPDSEIVVSAE